MSGAPALGIIGGMITRVCSRKTWRKGTQNEGLYNWRRQTGLSMSRFIAEHRAEIDAAIHRALDAKPHCPDLGRPTY